ncbi:hypothetical protein TIFTF001_016445 [Ficus carica]|uniref:DUF8039 domain-containing protein n=1 Tax=Ficus carica TaxID=3494 RepID=A0AA88D9W1_FICCA|nr:hypothetical protein TIFTF001_016445 [Ficus carica]
MGKKRLVVARITDRKRWRVEGSIISKSWRLEYNTQESQGNFKSVGTNDVLTQALSKPEHPGRTRGQSKFVKQSQYFTLKQSLNRDTEVLLMRREIKELKELSHECNLYIIDELQDGQLLVAFGRAWMESLPTDTVHGIPLGEGNVRVSIIVSKIKKAALPIPTYEATTVDETVNGFVA